MPEKTITEIPADPKLNGQRYRSKKLRVAAYCRVSTEEEEQHSSFDVQVKYYTEKIMNHPRLAAWPASLPTRAYPVCVLKTALSLTE